MVSGVDPVDWAEAKTGADAKTTSANNFFIVISLSG